MRDKVEAKFGGIVRVEEVREWVVVQERTEEELLEATRDRLYEEVKGGGMEDRSEMEAK